MSTRKKWVHNYDSDNAHQHFNKEQGGGVKGVGAGGKERGGRRREKEEEEGGERMGKKRRNFKTSIIVLK